MPNGYKYANIDLTGQKHGRLTVIRKADVGRSQWVCQCECGTVKTMYASKFFNDMSCGCLERENKMNLGRNTIKHGMTDTILYSKYCSMKERCHNKNYKYYYRYGGRGIKICQEWEDSFEAFVKWAYENGYDESKTKYEQSLDRIDLDGDYCPENCRWANQTQQVRNRSNSVHMIYNGKDTNPYEFAKEHGITNETFIYRRLKNGESAEDILFKWNMLNNTPKEYMKAKDAINHYGVTYNTLYKWIKSEKIKAIHVENKWYVLKGQDAPQNEGRNKKGQFLKKLNNKKLYYCGKK